eukprot:11489_3
MMRMMKMNRMTRATRLAATKEARHQAHLMRRLRQLVIAHVQHQRVIMDGHQRPSVHRVHRSNTAHLLSRNVWRGSVDVKLRLKSEQQRKPQQLS